MKNVGPGTYNLPSTFNLSKNKETAGQPIGGTSMIVPKYTPFTQA
jgi:hypothetical protein